MRNNKVLKFLSLILVLIMCFGFMMSCDRNEISEGENKGENEVDTISTYVVKNGVSPYSIVIPENPSEDILFAVSEMQYFFELCTGVDLSYTTDSQVTDKKGKYFSIGDTIIRKESDAEISYGKLGVDGYAIKTYGNALVMSGYTDKACIYSVYGYLELQFDLEIYAKDVFTYEKTRNAKLIDIDIIDIPDIPVRTGGTYLATDSIGVNRYRMRSTGDLYACWGHSFFTILPPSKFYNDHPEFYNKTISSNTGYPTQLALENTDMWDVFVREFEDFISGSGETTIYFNIGLEDNYNELYYDKELYYSKFGKYGQENSDSVAIVLFVKYVAEQVNEWLKTSYPNREIIISFFAYQQTVEPPVEWDSTKNSYVPLGEELELPDNVAVFLAPILANNFSYSYWDETNEDSKRQFEGWSVLADKMIVWGYSTDFANFIVPCNSWGSIKENYMHYKDAGVSYLYEQGMVSYYVPNYMELRQYLVAKLSWNTSLNEEELIKNFMKAYYCEGADYMYEYFNIMRSYLTSLESIDKYATARYGASNPDYSTYFIDTELFPKVFLDKLEKLTDSALLEVEKNGNSNAAFAIKKDRMPVRYMLLSMYKDSYDSETYLNMCYEFKDIAKKCGFVYNTEQSWDSTRLVDNIVNSWLIQ